MLRATWTGGSLRFWMLVGMAVSILPLAGSAVAVYIVLNHGVIAGFQDVAARQRDQVGPLQDLEIAVWEAAGQLDLYVDDGEQADEAAYRATRARVEAGFARTLQAFAGDPELRDLIGRARADWTDADHAASDIMAHAWAAGDQADDVLAKKNDAATAEAVDKLGAAAAGIREDLERDHSAALLSYERSGWITGIAATLSLLLAVGGVGVIGSVLIRSVDRLVDGAERFASGDRDHRIDISVPPELHRVAEEFNQMIVRIRQNEAALAELAHRDRLTGLLNRRAFDEALPDLRAQLRRRHEALALFVLDLDHFKRINDTHGHAAGDAALRTVAGVLASSLRDIDQAYRIGGEEFAVVVRGADAPTAGAMAERLRRLIADTPVVIDGLQLTVTVSIGVAAAEGDETAEALLHAADAALYDAKGTGRNRVAMRRAPALGV